MGRGITSLAEIILGEIFYRRDSKLLSDKLKGDFGNKSDGVKEESIKHEKAVAYMAEENRYFFKYNFC